MERDAMLGQLAADGAALSAAARDLEAAVPTCPGWTVRDAVEHTALVYAHKRLIIEQGLVEEADWPQGPPPGLDTSDVVALYDEQLHGILIALRERDPAMRVLTWYEPDQSVGFWVRRMMQETVIHRADVESASGSISVVPDEVVIDGIDELVERMLCYDDESYATAAGSGQRVVIETDGRAWAVTMGPAAATFERASVAGSDAVISSRPSDLLLALWNRLPYDAVTTEGDPAALAALRAAVVATTQ